VIETLWVRGSDPILWMLAVITLDRIKGTADRLRLFTGEGPVFLQTKLPKVIEIHT